MANNLEIERTYLAKYLPEDLFNHPHKEIIDMYLPRGAEHAHLRIRKSGDKMTITKKTSINANTHSQLLEENIDIDLAEYQSLQNANADITRKIRYFYPYAGRTAEIDIFQGKHQGLVVIEFEFATASEYEEFSMPEFCLADVSEEECFAGGIICKLDYAGVAQIIQKYGYQAL